MELNAIEVIGVVIAAIIGAIALFRTTSLKHIEYRQRAVWFFEDYVGASAKMLYNATDDDIKRYYETYMRYYIYASKEIQSKMDSLDDEINKEKNTKKYDELKNIVKFFAKYYRIEQYIPRERKHGREFINESDTDV